MGKKIKLISLAVCLTCYTGLAMAQDSPESQERQHHEQRLPREVPNPEKIATRMTDQMKESLQLTDKQYKKIYKLNLKEQKVRFKAMQNSGEQRPPMGGPGMRGGRPPMSGGEPPVMREGGPRGRMDDTPVMSKENGSVDSQKKAVEAKEKKLKKILNSEQYEKWQAEQMTVRQMASPKRKNN